MAGPEPDPYLAVATVRRPHGVRGELVLSLDTDRPQSVFRKGRVLELGDSTGRPLGRRLTVDRARPFKDGLLLKTVELASLTPEVEALRGHTLLIPASEAAPAGENEVHYRELVGMVVVQDEERIGVVHAVQETAAGELLAVRRDAGKELLLPFVAEWIVGVDRERRELRVRLPEGLLEL